MPYRVDDYSYFDDYTHDSSADIELSARDTALVATLPELDYDSQLIAIRRLLDSHHKAEEEQKDEIEKARQHAQNPLGKRHHDPSIALLEDDFRQQVWIERVHYSVYQDAAHSMAAVGLIVPLLESFFFQSFSGIGREMMSESSVPNDHERWQRSAEGRWDCHFVWENGRRIKNVVEGIMQLVVALDMKEHMPVDLQPTLSALFAYRNKMFHWGFEWPMKERKHFEQELSRWPEDWFSTAISGNDPWIFYMSASFVAHCLDRTEQIIEGIGRFRKERLR